MTAAPDGHAAPQPGLVLDLIVAQIGLGAYFGCLAALRASPLFVAAGAALNRPRPVTRASAAPSPAGDEGAKAEAEAGLATLPLTHAHAA